MGDIDFDELDKAVNTLMGSSPKPANGQQSDDDQTPPQNTLSIGDSLPPGQAPSYDKIGEVAKKIGSDALTETDETENAVRDLDGNGNISANNDTVPPAPNQPDLSVASPIMNPAPPVAPAPSAPNTVDTVSSPVSSAPAPVPTPTPTPASPPPPTGRFMDVMHPSSDMRNPLTQPTVPSPASEMPAGINPIPATPSTPSSAPTLNQAPAPQSPFLPNAEVQKRPLGSPMSGVGGQNVGSMMDQLNASGDNQPEQGGETTLINGEVQKDPNADDAQKAINPTDFGKQAAPTEEQALQGIESRDVGGGNPLGGTDMNVDAVESGDTEKLSSLKPWKDKKGELSNKSHDMYSVNASGAGKQKSSPVKILLIIGIILLFAGAGAAVYFILGVGL